MSAGRKPFNPPAFPFAATDPHNVSMQTGGMSLRDWFAGKALAGLLFSGNTPSSVPLAATTAYAMADAMLAAREVDQ